MWHLGNNNFPLTAASFVRYLAWHPAEVTGKQQQLLLLQDAFQWEGQITRGESSYCKPITDFNRQTVPTRQIENHNAVSKKKKNNLCPSKATFLDCANTHLKSSRHFMALFFRLSFILPVFGWGDQKWQQKLCYCALFRVQTATKSK